MRLNGKVFLFYLLDVLLATLMGYVLHVEVAVMLATLALFNTAMIRYGDKR